MKTTKTRKKHDYHRLAAQFGHIHRILFILRSEELKEFGITFPQLAILMRISVRNNNITPAKLARDMLRKQNTISLLLRRMLKSGLVQKQPDPKRKNSQLLSLTPKGKSIIGQYKQGKTIEKIYSQLSEEHLTQLEICIDELDNIAVSELHKMQKKSEYIGGNPGSEPL